MIAHCVRPSAQCPEEEKEGGKKKQKTKTVSPHTVSIRQSNLAEWFDVHFYSSALRISLLGDISDKSYRRPFAVHVAK